MSKNQTIRFDGYRNWFRKSYEQEELNIFVLGFESKTYKNNDIFINGIDIFFKDESGEKRQAFLQYDPYFYLQLRSNLLNQSQIIMNVIRQVRSMDDRVIDVVFEKKFDGEDITFPREYPFLKVIVNHPGSVPKLRDKLAEVDEVTHWREADVLFHHRVAIDHDLRVGYWYQATMTNGRIIHLKQLPDKPPPELSIMAMDLETEYHPERDPIITDDQILINTLFTGKHNYLIVQKDKLDTSNIRDFYIILREPDVTHDKQWVDWIPVDKDIDFPYHDKRLIQVIKVADQNALVRTTYEIIEAYQPDILTDFYGDKFDMPFFYVKSDQTYIDFLERTGFKINKKRDETGELLKDIEYVSGAGIIHLDAYLFNEKYSYLPKKDLGLKQSVEIKLKIKPIGREALTALSSNPSEAVGYAGCDGYITWRYVKEIVLDFYLSMGQMFPVAADEILTKRAGFLDDSLVDAESYKHNIIARKRQSDPTLNESVRLLTESLYVNEITCTGASVDVRNNGIFRSDLKYNMNINKEYLINDISPLMKDIIKEKVSLETNDGWKLVGNPYSQIDIIINQIINQNGRYVQLMGGHADVTSMYPSVIRQYKLQPNGVVSPLRCLTCMHREKDNGCMRDFKWIIKIKAQRLCAHYPCDQVSSGNCPDKCASYLPVDYDKVKKIQEIFALDGRKVVAYQIRDKKLVKIPSDKTYYSKTAKTNDVYINTRRWLKELKDEYELSSGLEYAVFDYIDDVEGLTYPKNTFLIVDIRKKKATIYLSVKTRICQKAYGHVSRIMEDFFQRRVEHKRKAKSLLKLIKDNDPSVTDLMIQQQKFHDSTQTGLKVPLNSVYGLMGIKRGVRNSVLAGAGITTYESMKIITEAANILDKISIVTELDTDGIWYFMDASFPQIFSIEFTNENDQKKIINIRFVEEILNKKARRMFRNDNYWVNDGKKIYKSPKALIAFEQDGPYDFQFVMGKKKYIIYNFDKKKSKWIKKEETGLETKRSDFSNMQKNFQTQIINAYLDHFNDNTFILVDDLYKHAEKYSKQFYKKIQQGEIPITNLIRPKAIKNDIDSYNPNLPQIRAARILEMIGFDIVPGIKINMIKLQGNFVVPYELFEMADNKKFLRILKSIQFMPLALMMGQIKTSKDLIKYLDLSEYKKEIFGADRIYDRMIGKFLDEEN